MVAVSSAWARSKGIQMHRHMAHAHTPALTHAFALTLTLTLTLAYTHIHTQALKSLARVNNSLEPSPAAADGGGMSRRIRRIKERRKAHMVKGATR